MFVPLSEEGSCGAVVPLSLSTDSICFLLLFESLMGLTLEMAVIGDMWVTPELRLPNSSNQLTAVSES